MFRAILILLLTLHSITAFPQNQQVSKLVIEAKEIYEVPTGNVLLVDTLIMHDKATIKFSPETKGILQVNYAIIGKKCIITSKGIDGRDTAFNKPGTQGMDGGDLDITINFSRLKSLIIDTQGGAGGKGLNGKDGKKGTPDRREKQKVKGRNGQDIITFVHIPGIPGTDGTNATQGHKGGNGGDITLTYSAKTFIPVFNHAKAPHSIILLHTMGNTGKDGKPGKGGFNSKDGEVIHKEKLEATDGQVKLVNVNGLSVQE